MILRFDITSAVVCLIAVLSSNAAQAASQESPAAGQGAVTLIANVMSNVHTGTKDKSLFLIAYDGTPEIKAAFDKIMADYPEKGLDADAAIKVQDQFMTQLRLEITLGEPIAEKLYTEAAHTIRQPMAVTGTIAERDRKKWITLTKAAPANFRFPAKMMAADRAFVMPDEEPIVLKISEGIELKCIHVPPGRFLMGEPFYQCRHWQEDPPRMVTLTRGYFLAEHPVTQEIYEAVMGNNPSTEKSAKMPVYNVDCERMYQFCEKLGEKTHMKIRVPTAAEWEYAARVGTSNPTFGEKYADQTSNATSRYNSPPLPVKSKKANPWGFYDMHSGWWERVSDSSSALDRLDIVDPIHIPRQDTDPDLRGKKHGHFGKGQFSYEISEVEYISSEAGEFRFRIVVEGEAK